MDWTQVMTFCLVASLLVMSPGPNGVLIAKTVPTSGRAAGCANVAGFVTAFALHGALSIMGISIILLQSAQLFTLVKLIGAAYLFWIGLKSLRDALRSSPQTSGASQAKRQRSLKIAYLEGLLTNALNPKVSMFYLAAFPQFMTTSDHAATSALFLVSLHALINAIWFGCMIMLLGRLTQMAQNQRFQRWLKGITGIVFIGFGVKLATYHARA